MKKAFGQSKNKLPLKKIPSKHPSFLIQKHRRRSTMTLRLFATPDTVFSRECSPPSLVPLPLSSALFSLSGFIRMEVARPGSLTRGMQKSEKGAAANVCVVASHAGNPPPPPSTVTPSEMTPEGPKSDPRILYPKKIPFFLKKNYAVRSKKKQNDQIKIWGKFPTVYETRRRSWTVWTLDGPPAPIVAARTTTRVTASSAAWPAAWDTTINQARYLLNVQRGRGENGVSSSQQHRGWGGTKSHD